MWTWIKWLAVEVVLKLIVPTLVATHDKLVDVTDWAMQALIALLDKIIAGATPIVQSMLGDHYPDLVHALRAAGVYYRLVDACVPAHQCMAIIAAAIGVVIAIRVIRWGLAFVPFVNLG
jgi:hypothetical protein